MNNYVKMCAYYDKSCDSGKLFDDLNIAKDESYEKYLNRYDVIYLDISLFIASTEDMKDVVSNLQRKVLEELREAYKDVKQEQTLYETLFNITDVTGNKFIVIIDEWDALFREAKNDTELQKQYIKLLRSLFKSSLTDKTIEAAYMTGILPIKKYGTQSALTDFEEYTMLQPEPLEEYVGFTEEEVIGLYEEATLDFSEIKSWYDGYIWGNDMHVYSPKYYMR